MYTSWYSVERRFKDNVHIGVSREFKEPHRKPSNFEIKFFLKNSPGRVHMNTTKVTNVAAVDVVSFSRLSTTRIIVIIIIYHIERCGAAAGRVEEATVAAHMHIVTEKEIPLQPPNGGRRLRRGRLLTTAKKTCVGFTR